METVLQFRGQSPATVKAGGAVGVSQRGFSGGETREDVGFGMVEPGIKLGFHMGYTRQNRN